MARPEWLRTFLAVYRAGSVTDAARVRALSQPAASQQLAGLERAVGTPLFVRTPSGMVPTERGRALYAEVASALDQLEAVLGGLDAGSLAAAREPVRLGCSAEYFSATVVPLLLRLDLDVVARFGPDTELADLLARGELDVAIAGSASSRRSITSVPAGERRFVLVGPPGSTPTPRFESLRILGAWRSERPWVAFSQELPTTRRFWQRHLGRPFPAFNLRLVAPDLRAVAAAVVEGLGCSLLPTFVCAHLVADGRMEEVHPVVDLVPPEPWFVSYRDGEDARPAVERLIMVLQEDVAGEPVDPDLRGSELPER